MGSLAGLIEHDKVGERRAAFKTLSVAQIKERLADYQKVFKEKHPQAGALPENTGGSETREARVVMGGQAW